MFVVGRYRYDRSYRVWHTRTQNIEITPSPCLLDSLAYFRHRLCSDFGGGLAHGSGARPVDVSKDVVDNPGRRKDCLVTVPLSD